MALKTQDFKVVFPIEFDERTEQEAYCKGFLSDVQVHVEDGLRYCLFFIDPTRLAQDLEQQTKWAKPYLAEPNMVVIPEIKSQSIQTAVAGLVADGSIAHFKPLD